MSLTELFDLLIRWFHVVAGILWIGNSMLFNWMDRNLEPKEGIDGKIWLLHSGAFYEIEKKLLKPGQMPSMVHWFMWQNFFTWLSGIFLLVVVYYLGESAWLVDPTQGHAPFGLAVLAAIGAIFGGFTVYDLMCRSPLQKRPALLGTLGFFLIVGIAWGLSQIMTPRAAYIHVGVLIGTMMTGNVWTVIIPSQRDLVKATKEGREQDRTLSMKAKMRSVHNNYLTYPLIFIMISNHFPSTYSHHMNWLILASLTVGGALTRHFLNIRFHFKQWKPAVAASVLVGIGGMYLAMMIPDQSGQQEAELRSSPTVGWSTVRQIIAVRCVSCHSATPSDEFYKNAPNGIMFDTPEQIASMSKRIRTRVASRTMPLDNRTNMTDEERQLVVRWVAQGANLAAKDAPDLHEKAEEPGDPKQTPPVQ